MDINNPIKYSDLVQPDSSITTLISQLQQLQSEYGNAISNLKTQAEGLATSLKNVSGATAQGREQTKQAATEVDRLREQHKKLAEAESGTHKELQRLKNATSEANKIMKLEVQLANSAEGSYNKLSAQYGLMKIKLNAMSEAERTATQAGRDLEAESKRIYEQMKKLQEATGQHQLNVGNYYNDITKAMQGYGSQIAMGAAGNSKLAQTFLMMGGQMQSTTTIMGGLKAGASALWSTLAGLATNPIFLAIAGVGGAVAGFKWWYDYNSGIQEATKLTMEFANVSGDALVNLRSEILAISDTWGKDYKETLQAIDSVAANFKISFEEAAKVVKDGFVAGADVNGDFLNKLQQYPAYFHEAGLSADKFVAIVAQTRSGIFGDQGLDAIKQANARIRQMTDATADSLSKLGLDVADLQKKLEEGSITTFDVLQMVSQELSELPPNAQIVGETLVNVFGKQGRDAGLEMIKSLQDISTNLDDVKAQTGELGQLEEQQAQAEKEFQVALAALFDQTGGNFEKMKTGVSVFIKKGLTALIKGIIQLINWLIDLYNRSMYVRIMWNSWVSAIKSIGAIIGNVFGAIVDAFKGIGNALKGLLTLDFDLLFKGVGQVMTAIPKLWAKTVKDIYNITADGIENINNKIEPIKIPTEVVSDGGSTTPVTTGGGGSSSSSSSSSGGSSSSSSSSGRRNRSGRSGTKTTPKTKAVDPAKEAERQFKEWERTYKEWLASKRKYEDAMLEIETNVWYKRRKQSEYNYKRQIEDLQYQLKYGKLTVEQTEWVNKRIEILQTELTMDLQKIESERIIAEQKSLKEALELRLKTVAEGSAEELKIRQQMLDADRKIALQQNAMRSDEEVQSDNLINAGFVEEGKKLLDEYNEVQLDLFDKEQALAQSEFDLLENSEKKKTEFRLKMERDRIKKILELNETAGHQLTEIEKQAYQNQLALIDKQLKENKDNDIYDVLGLNLSDEKKEAIDASLQYANEALDSFMNSYVQAAEAKAALADKEVENTKKVLENEIEARNQGYASDVATAQKELDLARKNQEKAKKQAEKAKKAQLAIQAAEQVGNLVTATSLILKQLGIWAAPALAVMWGTFAYSKIKAMQMVGKSESYGEGTVELLEGGSHQSGNDVDLGTKRNGTRRRAEGGEFFAIINKRNSRRFRKFIPDVINSLNDGSFPSKYLNAYRTDDGLTINLNNSSEEMKGLAADVKALRKANERKMFVDGRGNRIEVFKNVTRTIRQ